MYKVVFIGQPGSGKTTIICNWLGLLQADIVGRSNVDAVSLLPTAMGRTTAAEVHIRQCTEPSSHIRVEYLPVEQQKIRIKKFCADYYRRCTGLNLDRAQTDDSPHIEIERLICRMVGLPHPAPQPTPCSDWNCEAQRQKIIRSVLCYGSSEEFCETMLQRADLDNRQQRDFGLEHGDGFREELARLISELNNGNLETASIPKRINIDISLQDVDLHLPEFVDEVVDTIGLDSSVRDDLRERLRNPSELCVLVDHLENPPSQRIRSLLESIPAGEREIVKRKTALFINSNWDDLGRVSGADGDENRGIEIKRQEIDRVVTMGNIPYDINNTLFADPCGAYVISLTAGLRPGLIQKLGRNMQSSITSYDEKIVEEFRQNFNVRLETILRPLRLAEVRIEFARLKERTVPAIRAKLESVRSSPDATDELVRRTAGLETDLSEWVRQKEPAKDGLPGEERRAAEWKERIGRLENELLGLRHENAERFFREADRAFGKKELQTCIDAADECLAREPGREDAKRLADDARREIGRLETEIEQWKAWASSAVELQNLDPREPVFRTIVAKVSEQRAELRRLSDWRDHGKARSCKQEIERLLNGWKVSSARVDERNDFERTYRDVCANLQAFADEHGTLGRPAWEIEWESGDERFTSGQPEEAFKFYERAIHVAQGAADALEDRARMLSSAKETLETVNLRRSFLLNDAPSFSEEEFERDVRDGSAAFLGGGFREAQNRLLAVSRRLEQLSEACERLLDECYNKRFANRVLQEAGREAFLHVAVSIQRQIFGMEVAHDPDISAIRPPECPWMPPGERRRLPDPVALVRIVRDFDEAGSLYARLWSSAVRWSEQWNGSVFLVPGEDVAADRRKERLVDAMRHLVRLDVSPSDSLEEIERELSWFLETSAPRREWAARKKEWDDILKGPARKAFDSALPQASAEKAGDCVSKARSAVLSGDYATAETLLRTAVSLGPELTANGWAVVCRNKQEEVEQAGATAAEIAEIDERFDVRRRKLDESFFDDAIQIFEIACREYAVLHERTERAHTRATQCLGRADQAVSRLDELPESDSNEPFKIRTEKSAETVRACYDKRNWKSAIDAFLPLERAEQEIDFRKCRVELEDERRKLRECGLDAEGINRILSALDGDSFREIPEAEVTTPQNVIQSAENQIDRFASSLVQSWMQRHPDDLCDTESWSDLEETIERAPSFLRDRSWRISNDRYIPWNGSLSGRPLVRLFCREWDAANLVPAIEPKAVLSILRSPCKKEILDCLAGADAHGIDGLNLLARIAEPPHDREFSQEAGLRKWRHG